MNDADVIIIGAGHNSLAAGMVLSKAGLKVLVLEKASIPGGASKSAEITKPGFIHDLYATNVGLFMGSELYANYGEELHKNGFEVINHDKPYSNVFPDGDGLAIYRDADKTDQQIRRHSEHDAEAWKELIAYFNKTAPLFLPLMQKTLPSGDAAKQALKLVQSLKMKGAFDLAQLTLKSPREFTESWFENKKVQSLFIPWGFHLDYGPDVSGGATFAFVEAPSDYQNGMPIVKGGISNLINAMVKSIEDNGGLVLTDHDVKEIIVKNGRAVGVELMDGKQLSAKKAVLANVTPTQLVTRLVAKEHLPSQFVQKAKEYRYGPGTMMIHLALNEPLKWNAGEDFSNFTYVHIGPYVKEISETYTDAINGVLPSSPMLVIGQQTASDPSRAPEGKHTLWVQVRALPFEPTADRDGKIRPGKWADMKEAYAERVIDKIEEYAPNIKQSILSHTVLSPEDLMNDNMNLWKGDSVSGSHHINQNYVFRPFFGASKYDTPIKGLYISGASTWPGGGMNATSGYLAAKRILAQK
ncbi:phytoene desaturase family protein [Bacillus sp. 1P06AnD]|uniref:phytoene desaturase family protein n=1 Tax=Bacillus sp. 1P06AnD TaxID=3132208 RepID=UPI00399EFFA7